MSPTSAGTKPSVENPQGPGAREWSILGIAALAMVATLPGRTQGLGLITEPLIAELQIDRVTFGGLNFWTTLIGSAFCLPCGRLTDQFGSRAILTVVLAALGITVITMSRVETFAALAIAITLTRGLGQSALSVVSLALVGKWFTTRLHFAMGVYSLLVGIGFIAAFPSVGQTVLISGWRFAWLSIGIVLTAVITPMAWMVVRNGPRDREVSLAEDQPQDRRDLTLSDALRSGAFWIFALSSSIFGLVYSGIALFNQSILEQRGFGAGVYHTALVISTMVGLIANFAGGWIASKWSTQKLMGLGMAVLAASLLILPFARSFAHVVAYAVAMGAVGGVVTVVFFSVWGQVFGRAHLGRIQGCAQMMTVFASAIGPLLLAKTLEQTGSYELMFFLLAACVCVLGIASWRVRLPERPNFSSVPINVEVSGA